MVKSKTHEKSNLKPKEKLLKHLLEHKEPTSILQASGAIVADYKNTYNLVNEFTTKSIILKKNLGNTSQIRINLTPNQEIFSVESKRSEEFLTKHPKINIIKKYTEELYYPFLIVLIFGSYAKNTETSNSDIDLCIISDNKEKSKELHNKISLLSLKLEVQEFTTKEFISMISKNENNLGNEIIKNNIILYGTEDYYNLISKWMKKE